MHNPSVTKQDYTEILFISDNLANIKKAKNCLAESMRVPWNTKHCINIKDALPHMCNTDIIVLDLALLGSVEPRDVFINVNQLSTETPVIVISEEEDHNLSTYVMEEGAADIIVKGGFKRLVDAIEFALIRKNITRILSDKNRNERKARQDVRNIENIKAKKISDGKDQCIAWMYGGYSVENNSVIEKGVA